MLSVPDRFTELWPEVFDLCGISSLFTSTELSIRTFQRVRFVWVRFFHALFFVVALIAIHYTVNIHRPILQLYQISTFFIYFFIWLMSHILHTSTVHKTVSLADEGNSAYCQSRVLTSPGNDKIFIWAMSRINEYNLSHSMVKFCIYKKLLLFFQTFLCWQ